jgi:hypothetical protein
LLHKHRSEVIDPAIAKHRGRIVKLMGDGLLAEFSSVVEAVDCAAEIQRAMAARNGGSQGERQMAFRVGVHLGDIIVEGDDLYGDGVNIASRISSIWPIVAVSRLACASAWKPNQFAHKRHWVPFCHDAEAGRLLSELDLWRSPFYAPGRNRSRTIARASS